MTLKNKKISIKTAKRHFSTVGLVLILYTLNVLVLPLILKEFLLIYSKDLIDNRIIKDGITLICIFLGAIPFFFLQKNEKIPTKKILRGVNTTFTDLFIQGIVCLAACIFSIFISNALFSYLKLEGKLLASIGLNYYEADSLVYALTLVIFTPILEEYIYRGVLLKTLSKFSKSFACFSSALLYALAHGNFEEMLPAFLMAYLLNKIEYRYRSIEPTIVIHILINAFLYGLCFLPFKATKYISIVLLALLVLSLFLIASGKYQFVKIVKADNKKLNLYFYSNIFIIISMLIMIGHSVYILLA